MLTDTATKAASGDLSPTSPLLKLPGEIRNLIYSYVFTPEERLRYNKCTPLYNLRKKRTICDKKHGERRCNPKNPLQNVCKQLRRETEVLAFRNRTIEITICAPADDHLWRTIRSLENWYVVPERGIDSSAFGLVHTSV